MSGWRSGGCRSRPTPSQADATYQPRCAASGPVLDPAPRRFRRSSWRISVSGSFATTVTGPLMNLRHPLHVAAGAVGGARLVAPASRGRQGLFRRARRGPPGPKPRGWDLMTAWTGEATEGVQRHEVHSVLVKPTSRPRPSFRIR